MLKKFKIIFSSILFLLLLLMFHGINTHASVVNGIAMQPVYSSDQISKNGLLNPRVKPGSKVNLSFNIINLSYSTTDITVTPNTAVTSASPSIDYSKSNYKYDNSLKYNFRDFFDNKKINMKLQPKKATRISFTAKIPKDGFNGIILGGFYITTNQESTTNVNGTTLNNKYSYAMPVILKEDYKKAVPKLTLGDVQAQNTQTGPVVTSEIYNKRPAMISGMTMTTDIKDSNGNSIFHNYTNSNSVAPNSNFLKSSYITKNNLNPGTYHIKIVAKSDVGNWVLEKDFNVSVSQYLSTVLQNNSFLWLIILLIILVLLIILGYFIYRKIKKNKQANNLNKDDQNVSRTNNNNFK
ncbi:WxL protein host-binding domain-containing protein [Apilactobacillus micheneri]|uniref:WxL protein host-binding domain-containing protein n=1 Tax=Apilactobacillus micheneri TaxID=1899430 RepID=UPI00112BE2C1|nr:DUF3324 domain-containing protein [Apilactobacillus micheneri]TPR39095.1 DUF3324 domain-containing protein [Apilactobacillus micheneri]TPR50626.1 DUF3324 domain-containing protein [Apilactobacillus micheneri]TPR51641.1 DUF3324 domain-containing protein [Apilactobacillus micheneri]